MNVVIPLRGMVPRVVIAAALEELTLILVVLQYKMNAALETRSFRHGFSYILEEVLFRLIRDRVDGVEPQSVESVLVQPVEDILNEEIANDFAAFAVEVDRRAPWCLVLFGKEGLGIRMQVIAVRTEMVVDHIQEDHQSLLMCGLNQVLQIFGPSVTALRSIGQNAVVSPSPLARKIGDWHQLDGGYTEGDQIVEFLLHSFVCSRRREGTDVQFIENSFFPGLAGPFAVLPVEACGINYFTGTMHILRLEARSRIGNGQTVVDNELILHACPCFVAGHSEPTIL